MILKKLFITAVGLSATIDMLCADDILFKFPSEQKLASWFNANNFRSFERDLKLSQRLANQEFCLNDLETAIAATQSMLPLKYTLNGYYLRQRNSTLIGALAQAFAIKKIE